MTAAVVDANALAHAVDHARDAGHLERRVARVAGDHLVGDDAVAFHRD